ncbi:MULTISPECIES: oligosaccharide flippase family protein [unclassified Roseovarius]|uniref:oligosaccharide flippase family protein n=1 Tax=unclassified Roseovarius TaxID=2614913 RepID=UPI00273D528F|nr:MULTISPECIES: oligosaccharide flippase family protein [unclassified Roseovarius]
MSKSHRTSAKSASALRGGSWTLVSRVVIQAIQLVVFIVVARWVDPAAFGVFALVAACVVILEQLSMAGWAEYIMQNETAEEKMGSAVSIAVVSGCAASVLGVAIAVLAGPLFDTPDLVLLAAFMSIRVVFSATAAAYAGVLNWQDRLESAAVCAVLGEVTSLVVSIWGLLAGYGILALAFGRVAHGVTWALSAGISAGIRPQLPTDVSLIKDMVGFSRHIILTKVLFNLRLHASTFIIGGFVGPTAVGLFRAAQRVISGFEEIFSEPVRVLSWSLFRKARESEEGNRIGKFDELSQTFFRVQLYCATPVFVVIAILGQDLIVGLVGDEWAAAGPVVQILALAGLVRLPNHASIPVLSLAGRADLLPRIILLFSMITVSCILIAASYGIVAIALSELAAALIVFAINAYILKRFANIHWTRILKGCWRILPALGLAVAGHLFAVRMEIAQELPALLRVLILGSAMVALYTPVILVLDGTIRRMLTSQFRKDRSTSTKD